MRGILIGFIAVALSACSSTPNCEDDVEAFVIAQTFVERQLRSPSTADFPSITAPGVSSRPTTLQDGQCAFIVSLFVDAQNGFGATVRQNFIVTVAPEGETGNWSLVDIGAY